MKEQKKNDKQKMYLFSTEFGYQIFNVYKIYDDRNIIVFDNGEKEERSMTTYEITSTIKGVSEISINSMPDSYLPNHAVMSDNFDKLREYMLNMVMV